MSHDAALLEFLAQFDPVLFDLDGVILDSNMMKVDAMHEALLPYGRMATDRFIISFRTNFGRSRRDHFLAFHSEYLDATEEFELFYRDAGGRYAGLVSERYSDAPLCDEAQDILKETTRRGAASHVVTGTMTDEARAVLEAKGIARHFRSILGSPASKHENVRSILSNQGSTEARPILIGDASEDARVAYKCGIQFLFAGKFSLIKEQDVMREVGCSSVMAFSSLRRGAIVRQVQADGEVIR